MSEPLLDAYDERPFNSVERHQLRKFLKVMEDQKIQPEDLAEIAKIARGGKTTRLAIIGIAKFLGFLAVVITVITTMKSWLGAAILRIGG